MKIFLAGGLMLLLSLNGYCWGFFAHKLINYQAVFLLPPEMIVFYKPNIQFLEEHSVDPDKRRYAVQQEGPRHYIDMDTYKGKELPRAWSKAVKQLTQDSLLAHGIVPWWIQVTLQRLTKAFRDKNVHSILKISAELGHYIGDAHVPLHTSSNHNGQQTNQHGIHGFWESRVPELFANSAWDLYNGRAEFVKNPLDRTWTCINESFAASDSVLRFEKMLNDKFSADRKYAYENRDKQVIKQYSSEYATAYDRLLNGMVERRLRQSIQMVASFWYTAWVNAGKPDLNKLNETELNAEEKSELESMEKSWRDGKIIGRSCN
jgi:hypothetical protein